MQMKQKARQAPIFPWDTPSFRRRWPLGLYFSVRFTAKERRAQVRVYRARFEDLIKHGRPVADGICFMLRSGAENREHGCLESLIALAESSTRELMDLIVPAKRQTRSFDEFARLGPVRVFS